MASVTGLSEREIYEHAYALPCWEGHTDEEFTLFSTIDTAKDIWYILRKGREASEDPTTVGSRIDIIMPYCQSRLHWRAFDDVPCRDTPCPCGRPGHWVIRKSEAVSA